MGEIQIPTPPFFTNTLPNFFSELGLGTYQLVFLLLAAVWLAHRLATMYAFRLFDFSDLWLAARMVMDTVLPFRRRPVILQKGEEKPTSDLPARSLYGGRMSINLDAQNGFAAVLENTGSRVIVLGPQDVFPYMPAGFTRLRQVVDLRDQKVDITIAVTTKDGIPLFLREAGFTLHVRGSLFNTQKSTYQSCDKREVLKLVYQHWIGQDWEKPVKRHKALHDLVSTTLEDFLFHRTMMELLAEFPGLGDSVQSVRLDSPLLVQFAHEFNERYGEHGLQLVWTGQCEWLLPRTLDMDILLSEFPAAYREWIRNHRQIQAHSAIQSLREETSKLVRQVLKLADELRTSGEQEDAIILDLTRLYAVRIQEAIHLVESHGDRVPREWTRVSEFLEQILG